MDQEIFRVVVTGGPCAGKTSALAKALDWFSGYGVKVFVVPEAATLAFMGGVKIEELVPYPEKLASFQAGIFDLQLAMERVWFGFVALHDAPKVLLLSDRGLRDGRPYMNTVEFGQMALNKGFRSLDLFGRYNAVLHMVTAAKGAEEFYNLDNAARYESPEQARLRDEGALSAWNGHEHLRVIGNTRLQKDGTETNITFDEKLGRVRQELCRILGIPIPLEIERKFLVADCSSLDTSNYAEVATVEIHQNYLATSDSAVERRVRKTVGVMDGVSEPKDVLYTYTEKREIDALNRIETERVIDAREYSALMLQQMAGCAAIVKRRQTFIYLGQYFQFDVFIQPRSLAMLEVELTEENDSVTIPHFITIDREVTTDPRYRNANIAAGH